MADAKILQLTAAASRRRSFAAAQKKGDQGVGKTANPEAVQPKPPQAPGAPTPGAGPVAGLTGLNKAPPHAAAGPNGGPTSPAPYVQHALQLSKVAQANGAPRLSSAIRSVASTPHPADKAEVAKNYLSTLPPQVAQQHQHMFTKTLMGGQ